MSLELLTQYEKDQISERLLILGHHYQRDEVIEFADHTGDSFKLARRAAEQRDAEYIVFCGVHFMAESADVLSGPGQQVILPDLWRRVIRWQTWRRRTSSRCVGKSCWPVGPPT